MCIRDSYSAAYSKSEETESYLGIDKKVLNNMVYKVTNDFLMDFKKKLGRNFNLESINKRTQKDKLAHSQYTHFLILFLQTLTPTSVISVHLE